ncbi:MAG: hypothetical protein KDI13_05565 [Alphaproteobacteria bacterium]|nr:hypothetical protein [Alphaproteobacteria bacterium]
MKKLAALTALLLLTSATAFAPACAEDKTVGPEEKMSAKTYAPNYCAFTASFPEEPYVSRRCEGDSDDTCYNLVSYTKVFDNFDTSIRVEIICNPSTKETYDQLDEQAMKTTVRAMTRRSVIEAFEVNTREDEKYDYRQAALIGKGRVGVKDSIYIAQLWSSPSSLMSVEAEMVGEPLDTADELFAGILKTIGYTGEIKEDKEESSESKQSKTEQ